MAGELAHLPLPIYEGFERRRGRGRFWYPRAARDPAKFHRAQAEKLDAMEGRYREDKRKYGSYFNPSLIFKIRLAQVGIFEGKLREDLEEAGISTISSASNEPGYWVAFADAEQLAGFREKLKERSLGNSATFVDAIEDMDEIPPEEKIGELLGKRPIGESDFAYLDVEVWRMDAARTEEFIRGLKLLAAEHGGEVLDHMVTDSFCLIRMRMNGDFCKEVARMREVASIDRPPEFHVEDHLGKDVMDVTPGGPPAPGKPGILIVDSGVQYHPLLEGAIGGSIVLPTDDGRIREGGDVDDVGHGTQVAGMALYGDVDECIRSSGFEQNILIYSAKVMYRASDGDIVHERFPTFDEKALAERQLRDAVELTITGHRNCRTVNISFGNPHNIMTERGRQFSLASIIDELSFKHRDILFVVAAGNNMDDPAGEEIYPEYLANGAPERRIIDPATSVHALTVGSIAKYGVDGGMARGYPSPFTRMGPGLDGMIKPELVEYGGGYGPDIAALNPYWTGEKRLFTLVKGTSFSSPVVAHYLARMEDGLPPASRNLLKALLLSSASIPEERPGQLAAVDPCGKDSAARPLYNIYGYGRPALDDALRSGPNRVLLVHEGEIRPDGVELFSITVPEEFKVTAGRKSIEVSLAFDPPVNSNRADYMGIKMEFHLFKNSTAGEVKSSYSEIDPGEENDAVPGKFRRREITMSPGSRTRKRGAHQKAVKRWKGTPGFDTSRPLVLAVVCRKKWYGREDYKQTYAVVVTFRHEQEIDLYSRIKSLNQTRVRLAGDDAARGGQQPPPERPLLG